MAIPWTLKIGATTPAAIDPETTDVSLTRLQVDTRHAQILTFTENTKHYENTWDEDDRVELEWPTSTLVFKGRITETHRVGRQGEQVQYVAKDWRALSQNVVITRRGPDHTDGEHTYPQRVYNALSTDPDQIYNALADTASTVGEIIQDLFDDFDTYLQAEGGAGATAYESSDLTSLDYVPGKVVLEGVNFEQAIVAILAEQGTTWHIWVDTTGKWRFFNIRDVATTNTVTIGTDDVITDDLKRHLDGRFSAVEVYGKADRGEDVVPHVVGFGSDEQGNPLGGLLTLWDSSLEANWTRLLGSGAVDAGIIDATSGGNQIQDASKVWAPASFADGYVVFPRYSRDVRHTVATNTANTITMTGSLPGTGADAGDPYWAVSEQGENSDVYRLFQVADTDKRDIVNGTFGELDCCPHVIAVLRDSSNNIVGIDHIQVRLEGDGKFRTAIPMITGGNNGYQTGATLATDWKLVYCYRDSTLESTLKTRHPAAGHTGEVSGAPWSVNRVLPVVVPEFTDASDTTLFTGVAQEIHKAVSSVGTSGSLALAGIDWTYVDPRRRIHIGEASDTTNWESLGASLTSTTYELERQQTRLTLTDAGSTRDINYQEIINNFLARKAAAEDRIETDKLGDYVNCQSGGRRLDVSRTIGGAFSDGDGGGGNTRRQSRGQIPEPNYKWNQNPLFMNLHWNCVCDRFWTKCACVAGNPFGSPRLIGKIPCEPDNRNGMMLVHPGCGQVQSDPCHRSQMYWRQDGAIGPDCWPYYPKSCIGVPVSTNPTALQCPDDMTLGGLREGRCTQGSRFLIVIEPTDLNNGVSGNEIGTAQLLLLEIITRCNWMQHVYEAMCCLDNRIACIDAHVWGGTRCLGDELGGGRCPITIIAALDQIVGVIVMLAECIAEAKRAEGEDPRVMCPIVIPMLEFRGCGPC